MPLGIDDIKNLFVSDTVNNEALQKFIDNCSLTKNNHDAAALVAAQEMMGESGLAEPAPLTLTLLNALARHKKNNDIELLNIIMEHPSHDESTYAAILSNPAVNTEILKKIAERTESAENLHTITKHPDYITYILDSIIVSKRSTQAEDLITIAKHVDADQLDKIINHGNTTQMVLEEVVANKNLTPAIATAVLKTRMAERLSAKSLLTLVEHVNNAAELIQIATFPNTDSTVLNRIVLHTNHDEETLNVAATHSGVPVNWGRDNAILGSTKFRGISTKSLVALASRLRFSDKLRQIVTHSNHNKEVLLLSIANPSATPEILIIAMHSPYADKDVFAAIAASPYAGDPEITKIKDIAIFYANFNSAATPAEKTELLHKFHAESKAKGTVGSLPVEIQREVASAVIPKSDNSLKEQFTDPVALREVVKTVLTKAGFKL